MCSVISTVERFQSDLDIFSQTLKKKKSNGELKKKSLLIAQSEAIPETSLSRAELRWRLVHNPGSCVGGNACAGGGQAREEEKEEEEEEEEVLILVASLHLLQIRLA